MDLTKIIQTSFSNVQLVWIGIAFLFGLLSVFLFLKKKNAISVIFLLISGFILRFVVAGLDPFLQTWDEEFHALVAKNMMHDFLKPVLIQHPLLEFDYRDWTANHLWIHKQPWFLWQISLFFKLFGVSELVLRMPTVIMFSLLIPVIYRIGRLITTERIAWYGAFIYAYSFYFVNYVSGMVFTDHNDSAFIFYIALSILSWLEYRRCGKLKWIIAIGIFTGIAVLNKWLVGLLVYSGWFISIVINQKRDQWLNELKNVGIALILTLFIALPWQIYTYLAYPLENSIEFAFNNSRHLLEALDGHGETRWYHITLLSQQYGGVLVYFIILPGLYYLFKSVQNKLVKTALITLLVIPYTFFTLAATKMPMYCVVVCPILFLALGAILDKVIETVKQYIPARISTSIIFLFLCFLAYQNLYINEIENWHSEKYAEWKTKTTLATRFKEVIKESGHQYDVFFNCRGYNAVMFMFYGNNTAYGNYPTEQQYLKLKERNIRMATFEDPYIPDYLKNDHEIKKLPL